MCIYMLHGTVFSHHYSNGHWFVVVLPSFRCDSHKVHGMCTTECVSHCVIPPMSNARQSVFAGTAFAHHHTEFMFSVCVMQVGV